jgi:hypothetical protein
MTDDFKYQYALAGHFANRRRHACGGAGLMRPLGHIIATGLGLLVLAHNRRARQATA